MFKRRLGPDIHNAGTTTGAASGCPDIWELENGDIAVIGLRKTAALIASLPSDAGCGPDEEIIVLPRSLVLNARSDLNSLL
jgi:hypothetical protein